MKILNWFLSNVSNEFLEKVDHDAYITTFIIDEEDYEGGNEI